MGPGRITLLRRAFRSGTSEIWHARLSGAGGFSRAVLVKRLSPAVCAEPRHIERDRAEALLTARLCHPNVLTVFDYCVHDGQAVTLYEGVHAVELLRLLERATALRRPPAPRLALGIVRGVLQALDHAHHQAGDGHVGIAHGDLSPSNVLIEASGRVLVRDFGIPLQAGGSEPIARLDRLYGKPGYMCPELVTRGVVTARSDLFAVGILLFELLTFRRLFSAKDGAETLKAVALAQVDERIARYAADLPMPLRELMRRALKRQPDERFASAADMLRSIDAYFPGSPHDVASELAHFIADVAPPLEEEDGAPGASQSARPRSGRRTPSRMILPATDEVTTQAEADAIELWSNAVPPPLPDVQALLAGIEPVGPPPLPPDAHAPPPPRSAAVEPPPLPPEA